MDIVLNNTKTFTLEFLNNFFIKFWAAPPLVALTIFGNKILLFLTPGDIDGWLKLAVTASAGIMTLVYMRISSMRKARHEEEKHRQDLEKQRQDLMQDKMDAWISQYKKAIDMQIIPDGTTLGDFIKQLENIEAANNKTRLN